MIRDYIERRGGKRPGSGRKKGSRNNRNIIFSYKVQITIEQADLLKEWGDGDLSAGIRWLVEAAAPMVHKMEPH